MADLNVALMPDNPKVQKLQAQITTLEDALKKIEPDALSPKEALALPELNDGAR